MSLIQILRFCARRDETLVFKWEESETNWSSNIWVKEKSGKLSQRRTLHRPDHSLNAVSQPMTQLELQNRTRVFPDTFCLWQSCLNVNQYQSFIKLFKSGISATKLTFTLDIWFSLSKHYERRVIEYFYTEMKDVNTSSSLSMNCDCDGQFSSHFLTRQTVFSLWSITGKDLRNQDSRFFDKICIFVFKIWFKINFFWLFTSFVRTKLLSFTAAAWNPAVPTTAAVHWNVVQ